MRLNHIILRSGVARYKSLWTILNDSPDEFHLALIRWSIRETLPHLDQLAETINVLGPVDWLLLPEVNSGFFTMLPAEWQTLDKWIGKYWRQFDLRVSAEAAPYLTAPILINDDVNPYLHISADGHVRNCSYDTGGVALDESGVFSAITKLREMCPASTPSRRGIRP